MSLRNRFRPFRDALGSIAGRGAVLPITGMATVLSSRIVFDETGSLGFAWFSLLISLPLLIPISDFGIGAVLTDEVAKYGLGSKAFKSVAKRAITLLCLIGSIAMGMGCALTVGGFWAPILGLPNGVETELACFALTCIMAIGIPLGAGQRVLLGLGRQTMSTLILGCGGLVSLGLLVFLSANGDHSFATYGVAYTAGPLVAQMIVAAVALRMWSKSPVIDQEGKVAPVRIGRVALPMAVISIALPLAYQSDRVVLAHFASTDSLAIYSLVAILYGPLLSVISIGGQTLWPLFIRLSGSSEWRSTYWLSVRIFAVLGIALGSGLLVCGPLVSSFVGSDGVGASVQWTTYALFGLVLVMFACHTTNGMLLMDAAGRRFQAVGSVLLLVVKIPLSVFLAPKLGADGVILSTLIAASLCLVAPAALTLRDKLRSGRLYRSRPKHLATTS